MFFRKPRELRNTVVREHHKDLRATHLGKLIRRELKTDSKISVVVLPCMGLEKSLFEKVLGGRYKKRVIWLNEETGAALRRVHESRQGKLIICVPTAERIFESGADPELADLIKGMAEKGRADLPCQIAVFAGVESLRRQEPGEIVNLMAQAHCHYF